MITEMSRGLKMTSQIIATVVTILGAFWAIDSHYASAADLEKLNKSIETQVRTLRQERVEDEIFKLDMKKEAQQGKLSPEDAALYNRYVRRMENTMREQRMSDTK